MPDQAVAEIFETLGPIDLEHLPAGNLLIDQGIFTLAQALRLEETNVERVELLIQAKALAEERIRRAPQDAHAWMRLSQAEYFLNGPTGLVFEALDHSFVSAPFEHDLAWPRLRLGILLWSFLDENSQSHTMHQSSILWRLHGQQVQVAAFYRNMPPDAQASMRHLMDVEGEGMMFQRILAEQEAS